jgi:NAD(P)-dependent dehydrogenase (short-subunit alcohol dehydrogenase family)
MPEPRSVIVTGAAGGIGAAVCQRLADDGANVFALDVRAPAPDVAGTYIPLDVSDPAGVAHAVDAVADLAGGIDGLVAAAGLSEEPVAAEAMPIEVWDLTINVNLRGMFLTCQSVGRHMLAAGRGRIVAIASMSGNYIVNSPQQQVAYNASKAGVTALVKSLAYEWGPRGVLVNAVSPGYVGTPLLTSKTEMHPTWVAATPLARFATPAEVAAACSWLLSDESSYCLGTELLMDGGYSLP